MENKQNTPQGNLTLKIPVRITYKVIQAFLREKFIGENVKVEDKNGDVSNYAEILDMQIERSPEDEYDLLLDVKFRTLTSFFRNKRGTAMIHVALTFDDTEQEIAVTNYKLEVETNNWLMNKSLQSLANSFLYNKLKKKMRYDFKPMIKKQLEAANVKLHDQLEASKGVLLSGRVNNFRILDLIPGKERLVVIVSLEGNAVVDLREISLSKK